VPRVPTYQASDGWVSPNEAQLRAPDVSAGLEDIAQSGHRLGTALDQFADVKAQVLVNSSNAQATTQMLDSKSKAMAVTSQYKTLLGGAASDGQSAALKQLDDIKTEGLKAMPTPLMQKLYLMHSGEIFTNAADEVYSHAVGQIHVQDVSNGSGILESNQNDAYSAAGDPAKFPSAWSKAQDAARNLGALKGLNGPGLDSYVRDSNGKLLTGVVQKMIDAPDGGVEKATALANAYGGEENLNLGDRLAIAKVLKEPLEKQQAKSDFLLITSKIAPAGGAPSQGGPSVPMPLRQSPPEVYP